MLLQIIYIKAVDFKMHSWGHSVAECGFVQLILPRVSLFQDMVLDASRIAQLSVSVGVDLNIVLEGREGGRCRGAGRSQLVGEKE